MADPNHSDLEDPCDLFPPIAYRDRDEVFVVHAQEAPLAVCNQLVQARQTLRRLQRMHPRTALTVHRMPVNAPPCYDLA